MNKLDKVIMGTMGRKGDPNPYADKSSWSWFDYLIGYGCPLVLLLIFIVFILDVVNHA